MSLLANTDNSATRIERSHQEAMKTFMFSLCTRGNDCNKDRMDALYCSDASIRSNARTHWCWFCPLIEFFFIYLFLVLLFFFVHGCWLKHKLCFITVLIDTVLTEKFLNR